LIGVPALFARDGGISLGAIRFGAGTGSIARLAPLGAGAGSTNCGNTRGRCFGLGAYDGASC
jgi:hypothetical protein